MLARLLLGTDPKQRAFRVALLVVTLLGLGLRLFNFALRPPSLWQDEAYWAVNTLKFAAVDAQIRPLGFMLTTQALLHVLGPAAWVYRLLPFLGSVVSMALMPYVALRLFNSPWSRLLAVLLLAVSPVALEMAAEFKHYGVEVGVYVGLLAALLNYRERRSRLSLALLLGVAWLSFFYSITVIFVYPAVFGLLVWETFRTKDWRRLTASAAVALVCLGTITTVYFTTWRTIKANRAENKWGTWYDVFYLKNGLKTKYDSRLTWSTAKYFELAATPGVGRVLWKSEHVSAPKLERAKNVDWAVWSALHLAGIAWLVRRRRIWQLAVLWSPLLFVTGFNLAGRWPAGAFRTNTFYVPFAILLAAGAFDWLSQLPGESTEHARRWLHWLAPCCAALLLLPTVYFHPGLTEKGLWAKPGRFTEAMRLLPSSPPKSERRLIMDFESCRPWDYYTVYDKPTADVGPALRRAYPKTCIRNGKKIAAEMAKQNRRKNSFWMLLTDYRKFDGILENVPRYCSKSDVQWVEPRRHLLIRCVNR